VLDNDKILMSQHLDILLILYLSGSVMNSYYILTHLVLPTTLGYNSYWFSHLRDEKNEAEKELEVLLRSYIVFGGT
jgi:hypothetical protein